MLAPLPTGKKFLLVSLLTSSSASPAATGSASPVPAAVTPRLFLRPAPLGWYRSKQYSYK